MAQSKPSSIRSFRIHLRDAGSVLHRSHEVDLVRRMQDGSFHGGLLPERIRCYRSAVGRSRRLDLPWH